MNIYELTTGVRRFFLSVQPNNKVSEKTLFYINHMQNIDTVSLIF